MKSLEFGAIEPTLVSSPQKHDLPDDTNESCFVNNLKSFVQSKCNEVLLECNPGNAGDSIIQVGTFHFFESHNIPFRVIDPYTQISKDSVLWYSGGGNLVHYYSECKSWLKRFADSHLCIVLPHTINDMTFLRELHPQTILMCREKKSFSLCRQYFSGKTFLHQDMAFYLDVSRLGIIPKKGEGTLYALRKDVEKGTTALEVDNSLDVSRLFNYSPEVKSIVECALHFLDVINSFEKIITDRLHIAIGAYLLGKKHIHLYPNSYYKNRAVYDFSFQRTQVIFEEYT